jgi:hypothetical protein
MSTNERRPVTRQAPTREAVSPPADAQTAPPGSARETGDAFLRAADAAIDRALSRSPEEFLRQNRQLGGQ